MFRHFHQIYRITKKTILLIYFLQADTPLKASRRTGVMGRERGGGISTLHMKFNKRVEIEFWGISSRNGVFWEGGGTLP